MASAMRRSQSVSTDTSQRHRDEPVAEVGGQGLEPVGAAGGGHHGGAGGVQDLGEAVAEPAGGAGDDGDACRRGGTGW